MNLFIKISLGLALSATVHAAPASQTLRLEAATASDLIPATLVTAKATHLPGMQLETQALRLSWALPADSRIETTAPFVQLSREYWTTASAEALSQGTTIHTTAPGALIRLSPIGPAKRALLDPFAVELRAAGKSYVNGEGFANAANVAELNATGAEFSQGTVAFKLKPELGSGDLGIRLPNAPQAYLLHVFEPNSKEVLSLTTDRAVVQHGALFKVIARMNDGDALSAIQGALTAPGGQTFDLLFKRSGDGSYVATVRHDALIGAAPGLWEVHAFTGSANGVQRDARTAIASSIPRARLSGTASRTVESDGAIRVSLPVTVAASGRYEVRGTLYGVDASTGVLRPAAMAHAAAQLAGGAQELELVYDAATLRAAGVNPPLEIRDLTLMDQASLSVMEQRALGLKL